jgi:hypothetical protein
MENEVTQDLPVTLGLEPVALFEKPFDFSLLLEAVEGSIYPQE